MEQTGPFGAFPARAFSSDQWSTSLPDRGRDDPQEIAEKLREAIDTLRVDATRVDLWASALSGFARPIPDYDFEHRFRLKRTPEEPPKSG
jgi:hypothetical protein